MRVCRNEAEPAYGKKTDNAKLAAKLHRVGWHGREFSWTSSFLWLWEQPPRKADAALVMIGNAGMETDAANWDHFFNSNANLQLICVCCGENEDNVRASEGEEKFSAGNWGDKIRAGHQQKPDAVLRLAPDCGGAQARNMGAVFATAPVIIFMDAACAPEPGLAAAYLRVLRQGQALAARGRIRGGLEGKMLPGTQLGQTDLGRQSHPWSTDSCYNMAVNARVFHELGGFDESMSAADAALDFSMRLYAAKPEYAAQMYCADAVCRSHADMDVEEGDFGAGLHAKWGQAARREWGAMWAKAKSRFAAAGAF